MILDQVDLAEATAHKIKELDVSIDEREELVSKLLAFE